MDGWAIVALVFAMASFFLAIIQQGWHIRIKGWFQGVTVIPSTGVYRGIKKMANEIFRSNFSPEYIVGIDGGGYTIASFLAQELHIKEMASLAVSRTWQHHEVNSVKVGKKELEHISYVAGKRVLLVDDVSPTGQTLKEAREALEELTPKPEVKIAVLVCPVDSELDSPKISIERGFYDFCAYIVKFKGKPGNVKLPWSTFDI